MEAFFYLLVFTSILFFFTLLSIVLLVVSTNETVRDSESTREEKKLIHETRRLKKAEKAVLKHLNIKEIKDRQRAIKVGKLPHTQKHDVKVVDLRERRHIKRQRTNIKI